MGAALGARGGPIIFDDGAAEGSGPGSAFAVGVSGANVVAGDDAIDDGRLGMTIGKSAAANRGATDGPRGTTYCSTAGGTLGVVGALLRTALGLVEGGTFNGGRLLACTQVLPQ